ncbi:MAG: hypothetical protein K6G52_04315, partial [Treponemataceae bacterium]|nr:hypothetical protein [Treponemataceae bacterium]
MVSTALLAQASLTNQVTATTISNDIDMYCDVIDYKSVSFQDFLAFSQLSTNGVNVGYGQKFEDFYLGLYYDGILWDFTGTATGDAYENTKTGTNEMSVLLGIADMGFKLSAEVNSSITKENDVSGESYELENVDKSFYKVTLEWGGLTFDVKDSTIKPFAKFYYDRYNYTGTSGVTYTESYDYTDADNYTKTVVDNKLNARNFIYFNVGSKFDLPDFKEAQQGLVVRYAQNIGVGLNGESVTTVTGK